MTYLIKTKFEYLVKFLPNSRSRKVRTLIKEGFFYFPLLELNEEEFPLAFISPTYDSRYKNEQIEYRSFNGQLYKPALNFLYAEEELSEWTLKDCIKYVTPPVAYNSIFGVENESEFFEEGVSVVVEDDKNERISKLFPSCAHPRKIMFDNSIWELTREPRYDVVFYNGFGGYHAPFVTVDPDGPFNANQFDLAVDYILRKLTVCRGVATLYRRKNKMVKIYTKNNCRQCMMAKKWMEQRGVEFEVINLDESPEYVEHIQELGFKAAPVIEKGDFVFSGFSPDKLRQLV